jgi:hypothetical protein
VAGFTIVSEAFLRKVVVVNFWQRLHTLETVVNKTLSQENKIWNAGTLRITNVFSSLSPLTPFPPFRMTDPITIRFSSLSSEFSFQVARLFEILFSNALRKKSREIKWFTSILPLLIFIILNHPFSFKFIFFPPFDPFYITIGPM